MTNNDNEYKVIKTNLIYDGPVRLRLDTINFHGKTFRKEIVEHSPSVGIIPIINDNEIILIKQFRHAVNKNIIEIPAGKIEKNETPIQAAKRELEEETGYLGDLYSMNKGYLAPSYDTEIMHFFIAKNLRRGSGLHFMDEDENISNFKIKLDQAVHYCLNGNIQDCKTISAILIYYLHRHNFSNDYFT